MKTILQEINEILECNNSSFVHQNKAIRLLAKKLDFHLRNREEDSYTEDLSEINTLTKDELAKIGTQKLDNL